MYYEYTVYSNATSNNSNQYKDHGDKTVFHYGAEIKLSPTHLTEV